MERRREVLAASDAAEGTAALEALVGQARKDLRFARLLFEVKCWAQGPQLRAQLVCRLLRALAELDVKQPSTVFSLGTMAARRSQEFSPSELVQVLRDMALCHVRHLEALEALLDALCPQLHRCSPGELGQVAKTLTALRFPASRTFLAALQTASRARLAEFEADELAEVAWYMDGYGEPMCDLASSLPTGRCSRPILAVKGCLFNSAGQDFDEDILLPLATALLRQSQPPVAVPHVGGHTKRLLKALGVQALEPWAEARELIRLEAGGERREPREPEKAEVLDATAYSQEVARFGVENFGKIGGRCVLNQMGIGCLEEQWSEEVSRFISAWSQGGSESKALSHRQIYAFAEFHMASRCQPGDVVLEGTLLHLNGLWADPEHARKPWLCAVSLPLSKWVDRRLCAEFQLLSEVCDMLHHAGVRMTCPESRYSVEGYLKLYLSEPSCVSCLGAMKQFQVLLPGVDLFVGP